MHSKEKPLGEDVDLAADRPDNGWLHRRGSGKSHERGCDPMRQRTTAPYICQAGYRANPLSRWASARRRRAASFLRKRSGSRLTTRQAMRFCSMCCRMWARSTPYPSFPPGMGAAGYTMPLPEKDEMFNTRGRMLQDIMVSLGGRIAEELIFGRHHHRCFPGYQAGHPRWPGPW